MGRKHCGKRRNCSLRAISPFPVVFSKDLYCRHVKTRACLGNGLVSKNYHFYHKLEAYRTFSQTIHNSKGLKGKKPLKTLREEGKMLVSSIFSFFSQCFLRYIEVTFHKFQPHFNSSSANA